MTVIQVILKEVALCLCTVAAIVLAAAIFESCGRLKIAVALADCRGSEGRPCISAPSLQAYVNVCTCVSKSMRTEIFSPLATRAAGFVTDAPRVMFSCHACLSLARQNSLVVQVRY